VLEGCFNSGPCPRMEHSRPQRGTARAGRRPLKSSLRFSIGGSVSKRCHDSGGFDISHKRKNSRVLLMSCLHQAYNPVFRPRLCIRRSPRRSSRRKLFIQRPLRQHSNKFLQVGRCALIAQLSSRPRPPEALRRQWQSDDRPGRQLRRGGPPR
jgi:hypothetical protein